MSKQSFMRLICRLKLPLTRLPPSRTGISTKRDKTSVPKQHCFATRILCIEHLSHGSSTTIWARVLGMPCGNSFRDDFWPAEGMLSKEMALDIALETDFNGPGVFAQVNHLCSSVGLSEAQVSNRLKQRQLDLAYSAHASCPFMSIQN